MYHAVPWVLMMNQHQGRFNGSYTQTPETTYDTSQIITFQSSLLVTNWVAKMTHVVDLQALRNNSVKYKEVTRWCITSVFDHTVVVVALVVAVLVVLVVVVVEVVVVVVVVVAVVVVVVVVVVVPGLSRPPINIQQGKLFKLIIKSTCITTRHTMNEQPHYVTMPYC